MFTNKNGVSPKWKWMIFELGRKRDSIHVELVYKWILLVTKYFSYIVFVWFWFPVRKQKWPWIISLKIIWIGKSAKSVTREEG